MPGSTINIRPNVSMLSVLRHLNYKPWYAIAEFIDNSIDSYHREKEILHMLEENYVLTVKVEINSEANRIIIRDNAGGIHRSEFDRAFRTAEVPPDRSGLSEFGMGMKSAACWFTNNWSVRTKSIDDPYEYEVEFDIVRIVEERIEELDIKEKVARKEAHYTVIELKNVHNIPVKKTLGKIKEHLSSLYRQFIRDKTVRIFLNDDELQYDDPKILLAAFYKNENENAYISWRRDIEIEIDEKHKVCGFAAIREVGSTSDAGFALLRRRRVIQGSNGEGYRPEAIFGKPNSYIYQRIFGELNLEGFGVSHTKDGIQWDGLEDLFIKLLKQELKKDPDFIAQADGFRKRAKTPDSKSTSVIQSQNKSNNNNNNNSNCDTSDFFQNSNTRSIDTPPKTTKQLIFNESTHKIITFNVADNEWEVHVDLTSDETIKLWLDIGDNYIQSEKIPTDKRQLGIRISLVHPFMVNSVDARKSNIDPLIKIGVAIGIAETIAKESGIKFAREIRNHINDLLEDTLSKQELKDV